MRTRARLHALELAERDRRIAELEAENADLTEALENALLLLQEAENAPPPPAWKGGS